MDSAEWDRWITFHALYDLPDAFFMTAQLGCLIAAIMGNRLEPEKIVPFFERPRRAGSHGIPEFIAMARAHMAAKGKKVGK
jgi:hypothetical protein